MATFRKTETGLWRAEVYVNGVRKSKHHPTKTEAQIWAFNLEQELKNNERPILGKTVQDALFRYVEEVSVSKKGYRWERIRAAALGRTDFGQIELLELSKQSINNWIVVRQSSVSGATVNRELNFLSAVFERCVTHWHWLNVNPVRGTVRPKGAPPRDRRISDSEITAILCALDNFNWEIESFRHEIAVCFLFALETAMRWGEIWSLQWRDIHTEHAYLHLSDTKNGTARDVPLSSTAIKLLELLRKHCSSGQVFNGKPASAGTIFRRAVKEAKITNLVFHDTRHEGLTRLARKLEVLDLARMVGHRDPRSLMIYYNATATEIAARLG